MRVPPVPRFWGPGRPQTSIIRFRVPNHEGTLSYTYFPTGKVETIVSSNPHGVSAAYTWDDQNRLSTVVDNNLSGQNTTTYSYDDASNVATLKIPNGLTSTFTYDALNRLTELSTSTSPITDYKYTLGATGIRTNATEQSGRAIQGSYDNIYRLNGETITGDHRPVRLMQHGNQLLKFLRNEYLRLLQRLLAPSVYSNCEIALQPAERGLNRSILLIPES